ncbi:UNVERIFIED_ORG: putative membrane protein YeaQ/YmgE (transglycosylase-associated protein family) [Peribacillus simplex]
MLLKIQTRKKNVLFMVIIGGIIGWLAGMITGRDIPFGIVGNIIAGFVGSWLGSLILGNWGPVVAGYAIIPALIGAIVLVFILSLVLKSTCKASE